MKLSIIVPVYNVKKYIDKCVKSILSQSFTDFELLLINDGSTDGTADILKTYDDSRVRVINKENSGVSRTRNLGIELAQGEYIQFVDSDDWITTDSSRLMVSVANESGADMVVSDFYRVVSDRVSQKGDIYESGLITLELYAEHMMESPADYYYGVLWNKLFRRDILINHNVRMNPDVQWCEDFLFIMEYLMHTQNIYVLKAPVYYYVKRGGSLVNQNLNIHNTIRMKHFVFEYYQRFYKKVLSPDEYEKNRLFIYKFLADPATDGFVPPVFLPGSHRLGKERLYTIKAPDSNSDVYTKILFQKRLFENKLETAALKNGISLPMSQILYCVGRISNELSYSQLREYTGIPLADLHINIQKLVLGEYIQAPEFSAEDLSERKYTLTKKAQPIMSDLLTAEKRYLEAMQDFNLM